MGERARQSTPQDSTGRRRLKAVILAVAGILIVLLLGAVGYLAYNTIKENNLNCFEEPAMIIQTAPSHQTSTISSQPPMMTSTSSIITVTTKQPSTLSASTNLFSTSSASTTISSRTDSSESISSSMPVETTEQTFHQTSTMLSTSPRMNSANSIITVTTKQPSTLSASTNLLSTSTASTKSISSSTESTESISSSMPVVTTDPTPQVNLTASCESSTNPTGYSPLDCSSMEPCNSGVFYVFPYGERNDSVPVYCECYGEGEMWTVIQKRFDGSVDFNRNWTDYKNGFGDACGEYWLGNEVLNQLTVNKNFKLQILVTSWNGLRKFVLYDAFSLADEANGYRLNLGSYYGNAGTSMVGHNGYPFSTGDRDNDAKANMNQAVRYTGAWWYGDGMQSNLNGVYYPVPENPDNNGIIWSSAFGNDSLQETTMMIKQRIDE